MEQRSIRAGEPKAPAGSVPPTPGHLPRSTSDSTALTGTHTTMPPTQATRPTTGASMASFNTGRLPSRGSYGQPVAPTVAATNAQGRLAQPKSKQYVISAPIPQNSSQHAAMSIGRPSTQALPAKFNTTPRQEPLKGHKRSNTVSGIGEKLFGRSGSIFGGRGTQTAPRQKPSKRYPPTSMRDPFAGEEIRVSMDSRRSIQYGSNRKMSETGGENRPRRFCYQHLSPSGVFPQADRRLPKRNPKQVVPLINESSNVPRPELSALERAPPATERKMPWVWCLMDQGRGYWPQRSRSTTKPVLINNSRSCTVCNPRRTNLPRTAAHRPSTYTIMATIISTNINTPITRHRITMTSILVTPGHQCRLAGPEEAPTFYRRTIGSLPMLTSTNETPLITPAAPVQPGKSWIFSVEEPNPGPVMTVESGLLFR